MGIIYAILWGGCVSARKSHSFYTRIASSRRDEAISPLESSQLSHCKKAGVPQCRGGARETETMTWVSYMPFSGVALFRRGKAPLSTHGSLEMSVRVRSQPFPSWQVYLRIGFVSLMFQPTPMWDGLATQHWNGPASSGPGRSWARFGPRLATSDITSTPGLLRTKGKTDAVS